MPQLTAFEEAAVRVAINGLLIHRHFSICALDGILKVLGIPQGGRNYHTLNMLHCMDYADMPPAVLNGLPQVITEVLSQPSLNPNSVLVDFTIRSTGKQLRLVGD